MKCPECAGSSQKSRVYLGRSTRTLMGGGECYWDEEGESHQHDPNVTTTGFHCSLGHRWKTKERRPCHNRSCSYGKEEPS